MALRSFGGVFFRDNKPSPEAALAASNKDAPPPARVSRAEKVGAHRLAAGATCSTATWFRAPACARRTPASRRARTRSPRRGTRQYPPPCQPEGTKDTSSATRPRRTRRRSPSSSARGSRRRRRADAGSAALSWNANPVAACGSGTPVLCLSHLRPMNASSSSLPHRPDVLAAASSAARCVAAAASCSTRRIYPIRQRLLELGVLALELVRARRRASAPAAPLLRSASPRKCLRAPPPSRRSASSKRYDSASVIRPFSLVSFSLSLGLQLDARCPAAVSRTTRHPRARRGASALRPDRVLRRRRRRRRGRELLIPARAAPGRAAPGDGHAPPWRGVRVLSGQRAGTCSGGTSGDPVAGRPFRVQHRTRLPPRACPPRASGWTRATRDRPRFEASPLQPVVSRRRRTRMAESGEPGFSAFLDLALSLAAPAARAPAVLRLAVLLARLAASVLLRGIVSEVVVAASRSASFSASFSAGTGSVFFFFLLARGHRRVDARLDLRGVTAGEGSSRASGGSE